MSIFILTTDPLPLPGLSATGAGMRAWSLAQGLAAAGLQARALMPSTLLEGRADAAEAPYCDHIYPADDPAGFIEQAKPDALVAQHWGILARLGKCDLPLAIDLAGPHLLERRHWGQENLANDAAEKIECLTRADFVVCSGRDQRLYFLPWLTLAGFDPANPGLCPPILFSWPPQAPPRAAEPGSNEEILFFSGGVLLPWQDPKPALEALLSAMDEAEKGRLLFLGGAHPDLNVAGAECHALLEMLESHPRAELRPLAAFDDLPELLGRCDVAFDLLPRNNERELAFPTRTSMFLWAGLPIVHGDYDEPARLIQSYNAGWTLDPDNPAEIRRVALDILKNPAQLAERGVGARRLADENLNWEKTIGPLAAFCRNPTRRKRHEALFAAVDSDSTRVEALERELADAHQAYDALLGKWPMRFARRLKMLAWPLFPVIYAVAFLGAAAAAVCALAADFLAVKKN